MSDTGHLKCPRCGKELPPSAPEGLCPACLGALNFATETEVTGMDAKEALPPLSPAELAPHFPQLEILECLGRGGMGVVYKARQKSLNRLVALKLLAPERVQDAKFASRFAREAQALAALNHPNIVTIHDFGQAGGFYFLLMEFVDGVNLRQLLRSRKLQPTEALTIVPPICEALQFAHEHGIVHRDIKPENLLLAKDGRVKIADFGIAKMLGAVASDSSISLSSGGESQGEEAIPSDSATQQTTMGTPQYMAPEQRTQSQTADHRADIYSLGVVLYELLTGELPSDKLQPPSRKVQIDVRLDEIVLRALEKTPELRYQTAGEFKTQVEAVTASVNPTASKPSALLKQARGRYTSPEYLATPVGGFLKHEGKGELSLFADHLMFAAAGQRKRISFDSLRQLAAARGPRWTSPAGHQYLSLIYEEGDQKHHLLFMAGEGLFRLAADTEDTAADWVAAIQAAVRDSGRRAIPVPEGGSVVFGASPWLAALILIPMLLLATLPWVLQVARVLNPAPNQAPDPNRWIGLLPLLGFVGGGIVAVVLFSRRRKHSDSSGKSVSFHIATVIFYAGVILGLLLVDMLPFRFSRDSAYLLVIGIIALLSPFVGVMMGNALRQAEQSQNKARLEQLKGRLKGLSIVAWLLALPVIGFAIFFLFALLSLKGGWHPAVSEAVLVPLTWLGAGLLPWSALRLRQVCNITSSSSSRPAHPARSKAVAWLAFIAATLSGLVLAVFYWLADEVVPSVSTLARQQMLWGGFIFSIVAIVMGVKARRSNCGVVGLVVGLINATIWVVLFTSGDFHSAWYGRPTKRDFPYTQRLASEGFAREQMVVLNDVSTRSGREGFRLRTGSVTVLPAGADRNLRAVYFRSSQADFMVDLVANNRLVLAPGLKLADFPADHWDSATPEEVTEALGVEAEGVEVQASNDDRFYHLPPTGALPKILALQTADGYRGLVQLIGFTENPAGLKLRFKQIQVRGRYVDIPAEPPVSVGAQEVSPGKTSASGNVTTSRVSTRFAFPGASIVLTAAVLSVLFVGGVVLLVWSVRKHGAKGCLLAGAILLLVMLCLGFLVVLTSFWSYQAQPVPVMPGKVSALSGTATLVHEYEQDLRWRWRVTKQQPAQVLFGVLDADATDSYTNVIPVSLKESLPKDDDWSRPKDIVLTLIKDGKTSTLKLEDQFIAPEPLRPNTVSTVVSLQSWQNIITQSKPVVLSSEYYQTLWEAEVVRYSADGTFKSPRRLQLVARLADPKHAEDFSALSEEDPVKEIRTIEMNTASSHERGTATVGLVTKEIVEQARQRAERAKLLRSAGRASSGEVIDAETYLKWAEAMFQGDVRGALVAKRDGAATKQRNAEVMSKDRLDHAELDKANRELAEAEAALKLFDLKDAK